MLAALKQECLKKGALLRSVRKGESGNGRKQVHVSFKGIHVIDGDQEVHVAPGVVYVKENGEEKVNINKDKIFVNGKDDPEYSPWLTVPCPFIVAAIFLILGFVANAWHPGWKVFLRFRCITRCWMRLQSGS